MITTKQHAQNSQPPKRNAEAWNFMLAQRDAETAADKAASDRAEAKGKALAATLTTQEKRP